MANSADERFVWGDDFETILDILEEDEEIEEQFTSTVSWSALQLYSSFFFINL